MEPKAPPAEGTRQMGAVPATGPLLACVSSAPSSSRVVRVAARLAQDLGVPWVALHVDTPRAQAADGAAHERLHGHLELARSLGAEVVTARDADVVGGIVAYANRHSVSRVVIGRESALSRQRFGAASDRVRKLMRLRPDLELHVVPNTPGSQAASRFRPPRLLDPGAFTLSSAARAALILAAASGMGLAGFAWGVSEANVILVFLLAVLLVSLFAGRMLGLLSSVAAVLLFNFLFTEPRGTLRVNDLQYLVTFPVMLAVALITSELTSRLRHEARSAAQRERRTEQLYQATRALLSAAGSQTVINVGLAHLRGLLHREVLAFVPGEDAALTLHRLPPGVDGAAASAAATQVDEASWSLTHGQAAGCGTDVFPESGVLYCPLRVEERTLGVIGVECSGTPLPDPERTLLAAVAAQLALALDRERLARTAEEHRAAGEQERLRADLLRSISHDLRTPLAAIAGSSSTLLSAAGSLDTDTARDLAQGIYDDATWLTRLVENLLSLTRVEGSSLKLNRDWEVAEDLVASALERIRGHEAGHRFRVVLPKAPILVQVDAALMEQVLVNLFDNAIRYTPQGSTVEIRTAQTEEGVLFEVADDGPGLSAAALRHVFERFYTESGSHAERRGMGLGLAISKSIIEAHGGTIAVANREAGGAIFRLTLPRPASPPPPAAGSVR